MNNLLKIFLSFAILMLCMPLKSVEIELSDDDIAMEITGAVFSVLYRAKDENGDADTTLSDGGEDAEIAFSVTQALEGDLSAFFEIVIGSAILSGTEPDNNANFTDIFVGVEGDKFGRLMVTRNGDDEPFELNIGETLEALNEFGDISVSKEGDTDPDDYNRVQYRTPAFGNFTLEVGLADAPDQAQQSYVLSFNNQDVVGFNLGARRFHQNDQNINAVGGNIWLSYLDFTILGLYVSEETLDDDNQVIETDYQGGGLIYETDAIGEIKLALQQVDPEQGEDRTEFSIGFAREIYQGVSLHVEGVWFDKENNADDAIGIGMIFEI